jgi:hypothetical protein
MAREVEVKESIEYWKEKARESMATTGWGDDDSTSCGSMPGLVRPSVETAVMKRMRMTYLNGSRWAVAKERKRMT